MKILYLKSFHIIYLQLFNYVTVVTIGFYTNSTISSAGLRCSVRLRVGQVPDDVLKNVNSSQEDGLIEKLVVVVEQDRGVRQRREPEHRDPRGAEVARVRVGREYLRPHLQSVRGEGPGHPREPGVLGRHGGQTLVGDRLHEEAEADLGPGLGQPAAQPRLELREVQGGADADVKVEDELVWHHVNLH